MRDFDVIVIGAGAAGLMTAITAGNRGRRVVVLEGSNKIGKKILMSGGGRCNFTNLHCEPANFHSANPHYCVSALSRYSQWDFIALVERHGIAYHEKKAGQLFCDQSSRQIVEMLREECNQANVEIVTHCSIESVSKEARYVVASNQGNFAARSLTVASGGLSIPKMGASGFGYQLARQFGHSVLDTRAGLVPFTFSGAMQELTTKLSGISTPVGLTIGDVTLEDDLLFTHRGLSGPACLRISNYWHPGESMTVDLLPGSDAGEILLSGKRKQPNVRVRTILDKHLPRSLIASLQELLWQRFAEVALAEIPDTELTGIGTALQGWRLRPSGTEGYRTAEVTIGGVDTRELSSQTMESSRHPGLFFVGEVVDVTGQLGGFNFQWAWASGHAAGQAV